MIDWRDWSRKFEIAKIRIDDRRIPRQPDSWVRLHPVRPPEDLFARVSLTAIEAIEVYVHRFRLAGGEPPPDGRLEFWTPCDDVKHPYLYYVMHWVEWRGSQERGVALPRRYDGQVGSFSFVRSLKDTLP